MQKLVVENMEVLTQMRTSFDKPDHMAALFKKLTCNYTQRHDQLLFSHWEQQPICCFNMQ